MPGFFALPTEIIKWYDGKTTTLMSTVTKIAWDWYDANGEGDGTRDKANELHNAPAPPHLNRNCFALATLIVHFFNSLSVCLGLSLACFFRPFIPLFLLMSHIFGVLCYVCKSGGLRNWFLVLRSVSLSFYCCLAFRNGLISIVDSNDVDFMTHKHIGKNVRSCSLVYSFVSVSLSHIDH